MVSVGAMLKDLDEHDDPGFVRLANELVCGAVRSTRAPHAHVVKLAHWFGRRWLGASTGLLGVFGRLDVDDPVVPPFEAGHVLAEYHYRVDGAGAPVLAQPLRLYGAPGFGRGRLRQVCRHTACYWWSGRSRLEGRAALLAWLPVGDRHVGFYLGFARETSWRVVERRGVSLTELECYAAAGAAFADRADASGAE